MEIRLLYHRECPAWKEALEELSAALRELELGIDPALVEVRDDVDARKENLPGSPTILVDGEDLFPVPDPHYGLFCRIYLTEHGPRDHPTRGMIRKALDDRLAGKGQGE